MSIALNVPASPRPRLVPTPTRSDLLSSAPSPKSLVEQLDRHVVD
jgi:hypothetical protein